MSRGQFFVMWSIDTIQSQSKSQPSYFVDIDKMTPKYMERQKTQKSEYSIRKKNTFRRLTLTDFKTYYKATATNTGWYSWKKTQINSKPRNRPLDSNWSLPKEQDSLCNKWCWNNWTPTCKSTQRPSLHPSQTSKWFIDQKINIYRSIKLLETT